MWKANQCIEEGVCWVRADDFEEVAKKIEKINAILSKAPVNIVQQSLSGSADASPKSPDGDF
jgi:hypothetical protein